MNDVLLKPEEKAVFALRSLYSRYGYLPYKMSKFEEYDLYGKNKDFLISDGIITFTDARGKLLALKPDVTLSIIKNTKDAPDHTEKVYYNENVYRPARDSHVFKEIMQTGLECVGDIGIYHVCEVLTLAIKSLSLLDENYALDLSHIGLVAALLKEAEVDDKQKESLIACLEMKNEGALTAMETAGEVSKKTLDVMHALLGEYRTADEAVAALSPFAKGEEALAAMHEFTEIYRTLAAARLTDKVRIDFSLVNQMGYYSGVVFKGYIKGIPDSVLSGGRYDLLMRKMGRSSGAIGFAVYLDSYAQVKRERALFDADVLLLTEGASADVALRFVEQLSADGTRVRVATAMPGDGCFGRILRLVGEELVTVNGND